MFDTDANTPTETFLLQKLEERANFVVNQLVASLSTELKGSEGQQMYLAAQYLIGMGHCSGYNYSFISRRLSHEIKIMITHSFQTQYSAI